MKRSFRIILLLWRQSLIRELEFPKNFLFLFLVNAGRFGSQLLYVVILFDHTTALGGWSKEAAFVFLATWGLVTSIMQLLFEMNFVQFGEDIHDGRFDFYLLRPVDAQLVSSLQRLSFSHIGEPALYLAVLVFFLVKGFIAVTWGAVFGYSFLVLCGVITGYCLWFTMTTIVFWTPKVEHFNYFFTTIVSLVRYPLEIYGSIARKVFLTILPIGFLAAIPAEFLLGVGTATGLLYTTLMTVLIAVLTRVWWNFAIQHYASASS